MWSRYKVGRIEHPQYEVGGCRLSAGAADTLLLDRILGVADASGVEYGHGIAAEVEMEFEHVAGRAGKWRHDRRLPPRQPVEQGRLSRIGRTGDGNAQALAQTLPLPCPSADDLVGQWPDQRQ